MRTLAMVLSRTGILIQATCALAVAVAMLASHPPPGVNAASAIQPNAGAAASMQASWPPPPETDVFGTGWSRDCPESAPGLGWLSAPVGYHFSRAGPRHVQKRISAMYFNVLYFWIETQGSLSTLPAKGKAKMELQDRIDSYVRETRFPRSLFLSEDGRIVGTWIMGNDYRVQSSYYGGYPAGYLRRVRALFPDKRKILHLFSGKVDLTVLPGDTVDINPRLDPTYVDDAQTLERVPLEEYDLILADPPYSVEDAERYQTSMVKRNIVLRALQRTSPGTHIVWLDQVLPMYRKDTFGIDAVIGMVKSTNHRFRIMTVFRRVSEKSSDEYEDISSPRPARAVARAARASTASTA